ncbi:MAG: right-handed parallel beta-helix repeat-containing protein [Phycisphaerae bacterium]|nr:right-handed parallel beta-helix repeat-containing protein [Phycisphaerae bacterium]
MQFAKCVCSQTVWCVVACVLWAAGPAGGATIHVDDVAPPGGDGITWATAFVDLQEALNGAEVGDEIRVAGGTYNPAEQEGSRSATFQLISGVELYGGYAGCGEPDPDERNIRLYETILSGDLNIDDSPGFINYDENSYHVVTGSYTDETAILDGFTITGGNADGSSSKGDGAGIYNNSGSPTITNCIITANTASRNGGGIYCSSSNPAMTITNCIIRGNTASNEGGGIYCSTSNLSITNCIIMGNTANNGGGILSRYCNPIITNCIVWGNAASSSAQISVLNSSPVVTYSCIQDGWTGNGEENITDDPLLTRDGTHLQTGSPCQDSGDPNGDYNGQVDIDGELRGDDGLVDMGADEFLDTDDDGLPDWWELYYFESPTAGNPLDDNDGDGLNNLGEYVMSRNPWLAPRAFYVDLAGNDAWDGLAPVWDGQHGPKATIQNAIDAVSLYENDEIEVADGTYTGSGNKNLNFRGKVLTLRSANGPDTCTIDCENDGRAFYFHRLETATSVVDGFTLTNGSADSGGGVYCYGSSSPTIANCTITGNTANYDGGGIYCDDSSNPTIANCTITGNTVSGAYAKGGGICCYDSSNPTIANCTITGNVASGSNANGGGGICCYDSSNPTITNCTITGNTADDDDGGGGGIYCWNSSNPTITNCTITGNTASGAYANGGGIYCRDSSNPTITNCAITGNTASGSNAHGGGGICCYDSSNPTITNCTIIANTADYRGGGIHCDSSNPTITNCILWDNEALSGDQIYALSSSPVVTYSCVQNGWTGEGNSNADPLFVDPDGPDDVPGTEDDDLRLASNSPCIDAGKNAAVPADVADLDGDGNTTERTPVDLDGYPRFVDDPSTENTGVPCSGYGNIVDMGAYEFQPVQLIESVPSHEESLCRSAGNVIVLTFAADLEAPEPGDILIQELLAEGAYGPDMSTSGFSFTVEEPTYRLVITDEGTVLSNKTWIAVRHVGGWAGMGSFTVQYMIQVGDVNNDGRVMANDLSPIFPMIPTAGASPTERCDINGDGRVMADDLSPVFPNIPSPSVPKPCGH